MHRTRKRPRYTPFAPPMGDHPMGPYGVLKKYELVSVRRDPRYLSEGSANKTKEKGKGQPKWDPTGQNSGGLPTTGE